MTPRPPAPYTLLLDLGGHAARAALCDAAGRRFAVAERPVQTRRGAGGHVEHDGDDLLAALRCALDDLARQAAWAAGEVVAAGLSCQRASVICWERSSGRPLSPVLSWQDSRAAQLLFDAALDPEQVMGIAGLRPAPFFGASKLAWCWRHLPGLRAVAARGDLAWGPLASYLSFGLLAERPYRCSASIAQRSLLFDIRRGQWSPVLCAAFAIDPDSLPRPAPDLDDHGTLDFAHRAVPLRLCAGDQNLVPAALGGGQAARAAVNLGTGGFVFASLPEGAMPAPGLLASVLPSARMPSPLAQEGTVNGAGAAFDWLFERHGVDDPPWSALDRPALDAPFFCNRVGGLGSPLWQPAGESCFTTPPRDLAEAMASVADSIVHLLALNLERMRQTGATLGLDVGGGLSRSDGLCQRLADVCGLPLRRRVDPELSLRGLWRLLGGVDATDGESEATHFVPGLDADARRQRFRDWCAWLHGRLAVS